MTNYWSLDWSKRKTYCALEMPIKIIKLICNNKILNSEIRHKYNQNLNKFINTTTKIKKFCILTGRMRGNITKLKVNRTKFKTLINNGLISGVKNASW